MLQWGNSIWEPGGGGGGGEKGIVKCNTMKMSLYSMGSTGNLTVDQATINHFLFSNADTLLSLPKAQ